MIVELNLSRDEISEGISALNKILKKDINKQMIIETFNYNINSSLWPTLYYKVREEIIPALLGEKSSKALFWFLFGGHYIDENMNYTDNKMDESSLSFINFLVTNYTKDLIKAKGYTANPLGFNELVYTFNGDDLTNNLVFSRNDNENLTFRINANDFVKIVQNMVYYYKELFIANRNELEEELKDQINQIITDLNILIGVN